MKSVERPLQALVRRLRDPAEEPHDMGSTGVFWELIDRDVLDEAADAIESLGNALKVIHAWATFEDGTALDPEHVARLCSKTLYP